MGHPFDNPQPIDDTLIERIESGELDFTDKLFFLLIKETPLYLWHCIFQKRIAQWRYCLENPAFSAVEQKAAKKNLLQIGRTLALEHKGRPQIIPDIAIHHQYKKAIEEIDKFLQEHKNETPHDLWRSFQFAYPDNSKYVDFKRHRTTGEIAFDLIAKKYQISPRSLRTLLSSPPSYVIHPETISKKPE